MSLPPANQVAIIVPVYNAERVVGTTIKSITKHFPLVIAVNDGSQDNSAAEIVKTGAVLVEHPINLGQGAALQTGIDFALQYPAVQYFVTFDADGQHHIEDVLKMLGLMRQKNIDLVLGSRFLGSAPNIKLAKRLLLRLAVEFTNIFSGVKLSDTHNGLRVFNRHVAQNLNIMMNGMAHASEIIDKVGRHHWQYQEVPVTITYDDYSRSHGQSMINAVNILTDLLLTRRKP